MADAATKGNAALETLEMRDSNKGPQDKSTITAGLTGSEADKTPPKKPLAKRLIRFVQDQWFLITMVILMILASQAQVPKAQQKTKTTVVTYLCASVIFFVTGLTMKTRTLIENYARWKLHLFVQVQCFFITSLVFFAIVSAAASNRHFMDPGLLVGMTLTGCVATTISSNVVMTGQGHGNQALTVVESTLGNFLGPFLTPLLFKGYMNNRGWYTSILPKESNGYAALYARVFKQLGLSVFIPMIAGQILCNLFPDPVKKISTKFKISKLGSAALLVIIWQTWDSAFSSNALSSVPASNILFIVFMSIGLFFLFLLLSFYSSKVWLSRADTVAVCYCGPAKTPAMGVPLSTVLFVGLSPMLEAKIQLPLVIYQGLQILAGTVLTGVFAKWVDDGKAKEQEEATGRPGV